MTALLADHAVAATSARVPRAASERYSGELLPRPAERQPRELSREQLRVRKFLRENHGLLARIARETELSIQFVSRIAYNQTDSKSKGLRVEHALISAGCPLIQKIR